MTKAATVCNRHSGGSDIFIAAKDCCGPPGKRKQLFGRLQSGSIRKVACYDMRRIKIDTSFCQSGLVSADPGFAQSGRLEWSENLINRA